MRRGARVERIGWTDAAVCLVAFGFDWVSKDSPQRWRWDGQLVPVQVVLGYHLVGGLLLFGRRRFPVLTFAAAWVYGLGRLVIHGITPWSVPVFALQAVVARCSTRAARWAVAALLVPFGIDVVLGHEVGERDPMGVLATITTMAFAAFCAVWLGSREKQSARTVQLAEQRLEQVATEVLEAERRRLARELHDSLGHAITAMTLQAAGARAVGSASGLDPRVASSLDAIEDTGTSAMRELHRLLGVLRTHGEVPTERTAQPGLAEIAGLAAAARAGGLTVCLEREGAGDPDPSVAFAMYRVAQEGLVNAMRHDGPGADVAVRIGTGPTQATVEVVSSPGRGRGRVGVPRQSASGGFGLSGLRERVLLVGGTFTAGPAGTAFVTRAAFPTRPGHGARPGSGVPRDGDVAPSPV